MLAPFLHMESIEIYITFFSLTVSVLGMEVNVIILMSQKLYKFKMRCVLESVCFNE